MSLKKYSAFVAGIALTCMVQGNAFAATDVYVEGVYDSGSDDVMIEIYADTDAALISGGVAVEFDTSQIVPPSQTEITDDAATSRATKGADWKIGTAPYMLPQVAVNASKGKVSYILGKYDPAETTQTGLTGHRVLLGKGKFKIASGYNPIGKGVNAFDSVSLGLAYDRDLSTSEGQYVHFASTAGADLDGSVNIKSVTIRERGDANADGMISGSDKGKINDLILGL